MVAAGKPHLGLALLGAGVAGAWAAADVQRAVLADTVGGCPAGAGGSCSPSLALLQRGSGPRPAAPQHRRPSSLLGDLPYYSPYAITLEAEESVLLDDLTERLALNPADIPYDQWYTEETGKKLSSWGPRAAAYPSWDGPLDPHIRRQRLLAVAREFIGTTYQHHHIPQWDPYAHGYTSAAGRPNTWPWAKVTIGKGTAGIDCSDFAAYAYNLAFGILMETNVVDQAEGTGVRTAFGEQLKPIVHAMPGRAGTTIPNEPGDLDAVIAKLQPGDLVFVRNLKEGQVASIEVGEVSHVVIWLGEFGTLTNGTASTKHLVLSSHDNTPPIRDVQGHLPPPGVQILPFEGDWFYEGFSHALSIL